MSEGVAYLCGEYPRATDTFIRREIDGLRKEGLRIETISVRKPAKGEQGTDEQEQERRNTFYLLPCSPAALIGAHFFFFLSAPARYFKTLKTALTVRAPGLKALVYQLFYFAEAGLVAARMKETGLTHIHNHAPDACGYVTMLAAAMGNLTYSMTLHGYGIFAEPKKWRLKEKIEGSRFSVCISHHGLSQAMLQTECTNWPKLHVVHCGIDTSEPCPLKNHRGAGSNILFIGRLDPVKGLPLLLDAFYSLLKEFPDAHLHIAGDGPSRTELEAITARKGLTDKIIFHGYLSQTELGRLLEETDVMAMTSFFEGIPVVLMEAMAKGIPVVAPWIAGIPELVENNVSGILTKPADAESLVKGLSAVMKDGQLRNSLAAEARKKVESEFSIGKEISKMAELFGNNSKPQ